MLVRNGVPLLVAQQGCICRNLAGCGCSVGSVGGGDVGQGGGDGAAAVIAARAMRWNGGGHGRGGRCL